MPYPVYKPRNFGRVTILGAGSSFGSSISNPPPLISNFIKHGLEIIKLDFSPLWHFLDTIGYDLVALKNGKPNIEEIYSELEIISQGLWHAHENEYFEDLGEDFWKFTPVSFLNSFIVEVINPASIAAIKTPCRLHDALAQNLQQGDTIISFNYDLIIDSSMKNQASWSELGGYGFFCVELMSDEYEDWIDPDYKSEVALLKPHGSINWKESVRTIPEEGEFQFQHTFGDFHQRISGVAPKQKREISILPIKSIKAKSYSGVLTPRMVEYYKKERARFPDEKWIYKRVERSPLEVGIIPPARSKFRDPIIPSEMNLVWSNIRKALLLAGEIVCIGYSFNPNDAEFYTLFKYAVAKNSNPDLNVQVVNPDENVAKSIQRILPNVQVHHLYNTLEEYVSSL